MFAACSSLPLFVLKTPPPPSSSISFFNKRPTFLSPNSKCFHRPRLVAASHTNISPELQQSINNQTKISTKIATHLFTNQFHNTNFVFSPVAIHTALRYIASDSKGKTLHHLLSFLEAKSFSEVDSIVNHCATLFPEKIEGPGHGWNIGVYKRLYQQDVDTVFKAGFHQIYGSKGAWFEEFDSLETKECDFTLLDGNKVRVPFMSSKGKQYLCEYDGFKVMGFPHFPDQKNCKLSMYFFLPNAKDGLHSLIEKIKATPDFFESHIPDQKVEIGEFLLPKFMIFTEFFASDVLKELGLVLPFNEDALTEMVDSPSGQSVFVSSLHHKSLVVVDESTTKVATGSALADEGCSHVIKPKVNFVADHPFLFVVKDDVNKFVLFMGQVIDPSIQPEDIDCYDEY